MCYPTDALTGSNLKSLWNIQARIIERREDTNGNRTPGKEVTGSYVFSMLTDVLCSVQYWRETRLQLRVNRYKSDENNLAKFQQFKQLF